MELITLLSNYNVNVKRINSIKMGWRMLIVLSSIIVTLTGFTSGESRTKSDFNQHFSTRGATASYGDIADRTALSLSNNTRLLYDQGDRSGGNSQSNQAGNSTRGISVHAISKYISYREAVNSQVAKKYSIKNVPTERQLLIMRNMGIKFFDPLREYFNRPIHISSFFRSRLLNEKVGGSTTSHHMIPKNICAIDIDQDPYKQGPSNLELFNYIKDNLDFHVLIWEFGASSPQWVHIAYSLDEEDNQTRRVYKSSSQNGIIIYTRF